MRHDLILKQFPETPKTETVDFDFADLLLETLSSPGVRPALTAGVPPMVRVRGRLQPLEGYQRIDAHGYARDHLSILNNDQRQKLEKQLAARLRLRLRRYRSFPRQRVLSSAAPSARPSA